MILQPELAVAGRREGRTRLELLDPPVGRAIRPQHAARVVERAPRE